MPALGSGLPGGRYNRATLESDLATDLIHSGTSSSSSLSLGHSWPTVGMAQDGLGRAHGSNMSCVESLSNSHQPLQIGDLRLIILTHQPSEIIANVLISDFE